MNPLTRQDLDEQLTPIREAIQGIQETIKVIPQIQETIKVIPQIQETISVIPQIQETIKVIPQIQETISVIPQIQETVRDLSRMVIDLHLKLPDMMREMREIVHDSEDRLMAHMDALYARSDVQRQEQLLLGEGLQRLRRRQKRAGKTLKLHAGRLDRLEQQTQIVPGP